MKIIDNKRKIESVLLVCALVSTIMVVAFPLTVPPKVKAIPPVQHLNSAFMEDGDPNYDADLTVNGVVVWTSAEDHWIMANIMEPGGPGYVVEPGMRLEIPGLNYPGMYPTEIVFQAGADRIEVDGTLITKSDNNDLTKTRIRAMGGEAGWKGIYFHSGSNGSIQDCQIEGAIDGIVFESGSNMISPGIYNNKFMDYGDYGVCLKGALGYTNIARCNFHDTKETGIGLYVANGSLNITANTVFTSHGPGLSSLYITNATVYADSTISFKGNYTPGNCVYIENNSIPNSTVLDNCDFRQGNETTTDNFYIRCDGASPFIDNCSFITLNGARSVVANENALGDPAHPILRQPTADGDPGFWDDTFDNTTISATGSSSVTLQWYMNVNVRDQDGHVINNAPVWVNDTLGNPAEPPSKTTDSNGWARWFIVTELIQYSGTVDNFNPFNVSAQNLSSPLGYADPEPTMDMSKEVTVIVPFSLIPNFPPEVTWITTPVGVQSGLITINYKVVDLNPTDDGNLDVTVWYSTDGTNWKPATQGGGDSLTGLNNNTVYTFIWDSENGKDIPGVYNTTVYIKIVPYDGYGEGISNQTYAFTVDNKAPQLVSGPVVTATNTTALIQWTMDEPADAAVWYGFTLTSPVFTTETLGSTGTALQTVTLTNLQPGRSYTFIINSTDPFGHKYSSYPNNFTFETEVHIQLYAGWNMISIPPMFPEQGSFPWVSVVLASIVNDWDIVEWYDASDTKDPWKINCTYKPFGNDLHEIYANMGLWIHMLNDTVLIPPHWDPTTDGMTPNTTPVDLYEGWNFVGYPSVETRLTTEALSGVPYDMVKTYDAVTMKWLSYDGSSGDLTEMEMGRGYWIHATADYIWQVDYV